MRKRNNIQYQKLKERLKKTNLSKISNKNFNITTPKNIKYTIQFFYVEKKGILLIFIKDYNDGSSQINRNLLIEYYAYGDRNFMALKDYPPYILLDKKLKHLMKDTNLYLKNVRLDQNSINYYDEALRQARILLHEFTR